jgi:hypothetical protein
MPSGYCKNRRFEGTYRLHYQGDKNRRAGNNISSNWQMQHDLRRADYSHLRMEAILFSETSVLTRATRRNMPADGILNSNSCENLKYYLEQ